MDIKRILISVDNSAVALNTARVGMDIAKQLSAEVALIYVVDRNKETLNVDLGIMPGQSEMLLLKQAQATLEEMKKLYTGIVELQCFTPEGFPNEVIVKYAQTWQADLIIIGNREKKGIERFLNASVMEYVIKNAPVPVMVIPQKKS